MKTPTSQTKAAHVEPVTSFIRATSKATRKAALLFFSIATLLAGGAGTARAQSALDGFDPNANGLVRVSVVQPDGKILMGGNFSTVLGVTRNHIARLNADGTLDTTFSPNADDSVLTLRVQADGRILAGGVFTSIGGQARSCIARLDPVTGLADSWNPNATSTTAHNGVNSISVQVDGKVLAGGDFTSIGGQIRNGLARLDTGTGAADSWNPNANGDTVSVAIQPDGKILVAGGFGVIGGQVRAFIARLDPVTGLADSFNPNPNNAVFSIAVQADGKVLAGGQFISIGGQTRIGIARLGAITGAADSWNPNASANSVVLSVAIQSDGKILAAGNFSNIGGQTRNNLARLDSVTGLADSFDPSANSFVLSIAVQQDGKILAGGQFTTFAPNGGAAVTRNNIARLEANGGVDRTLDLAAVGSIVIATAVQPDGKMLIGGDFTSVLGVTRNRIARLNADGTLDMAFNPNSQAQVYAIAVQADGKILAGGQFFLFIGGQPRQFIARLDPVTGLADDWNPNADSEVDSIAVQADGKILAVGSFNNIGGQARRSVARLDAVTGLADSWNANSNDTVKSIAVQADGKILLGGLFHGANSIGGQLRNYIARLDAVTGLADSWDPNSDNQVESIAVLTDGKVVAGGSFHNIGGQPRTFTARLDAVTGTADLFDPGTTSSFNDDFSIAAQADGKVLVSGTFSGIVGVQTRNRIVRLDGVTGLADSFDPNANNTVHAVAVLPDGKILAGGIFTNIGGQPRNTFARLSNDTAALQNIAATPTTVTWTRGGSSPQFWRVTFESSNDNVTYIPLGNGTASGNSWTLTGLSLPIRQNFYIRARGYYRSGYQNGSESIAETVRNAFIAPPPTPTQVVSRKLHGGVPFDIPLPLTGNSGIECRSGGATNDYQVVVTFPSSVTFNAAGVTAGAGLSSSSSGSGTSTITVNLTGVTNAQRITVTFLGVSDGTTTGNLDIPMAVLVGDTTGNGTVSASDVTQTKGQSGQAVTAANFRTDVNANGSINGSDVSLVKSRSGTALP
jgi:uncharacterized delta-60 repeat protein